MPLQRTETDTAVLLPPPSATVTAAMQAKMARFLCVSTSSHCTSFTDRAMILPAAPPQAHTRHSTHDRYVPHSCCAQTANHPGRPRTGRPPTALTPLACLDMCVVSWSKTRLSDRSFTVVNVSLCVTSVDDYTHPTCSCNCILEKSFVCALWQQSTYCCA